MSGKNTSPSPPPTTHRIMVNLSAPKKSHTFNENEIPSHKESVKILLNGDSAHQNGTNGSNGVNGASHQNGTKQQYPKEVIHFHKPLVRTSSNINPVNVYIFYLFCVMLIKRCELIYGNNFFFKLKIRLKHAFKRQYLNDVMYKNAIFKEKFSKLYEKLTTCV